MDSLAPAGPSTPAICLRCRKPLPAPHRRSRRFCSGSCRTLAHRARRQLRGPAGAVPCAGATQPAVTGALLTLSEIQQAVARLAQQLSEVATTQRPSAAASPSHDSAHLHETEQSLRHARARIAEMESQLALVRREREEAGQALEAANRQRAEVQTKADESRYLLVQERTFRQQLTEQTERARRQLQAAEKECEQLRAERDAASAAACGRASELQQLLDTRTRELTSAHAQIDRLKAARAGEQTTDREVLARLRSELSEQAQTSERLAQEARTLRERLQAVEREREREREDERKRRAAHQAEQEQSGMRIAQMQHEIEAQQAQIERQSAQLRTAQAQAQRCAELEVQLAERTAQYTALQKQREEDLAVIERFAHSVEARALPRTKTDSEQLLELMREKVRIGAELARQKFQRGSWNCDASLLPITSAEDIRARAREDARKARQEYATRLRRSGEPSVRWVREFELLDPASEATLRRLVQEQIEELRRELAKLR